MKLYCLTSLAHTLLGLDTAYPELSLMRAVRFTGFKSQGPSLTFVFILTALYSFAERLRAAREARVADGDSCTATVATPKSHTSGEQGSGFTC